MPQPHQRHLFIGGCPRSGTSALAFLLNEHPHVALGFERFKRVRAQLDPFHFSAPQFFSPVLAETDIRGELLYRRLRARWEGGSVTVVGDKVPLYTRVLPQLLARFPGARVAVLMRDPLAVARSFARRAEDPQDWWPAANDHRLAMTMWNEALAAVQAVDGERAREGGEEEGRVALLSYEALFCGEERWLEFLLAFAGVPPSTRVQAEYRRLAESWSARAAGPPAEAELVDYVRAHADSELHSWAQRRMERQLAWTPAVESIAPAADEPPLSPEESSERERERRQLLEEMRHPGRRAEDEVAVLERRFVEQSGELAQRGERLVRPSGRARPRITFIAPHQRATTGGVYVIEQFARHLATAADVCVAVAVRERPTREIPGVEVCWVEDLRGDALPQADVLVYPADLHDADGIFELPARVGRPVLFFQGYGTPGSPVVEANLSAAREAVAVARWLQDLALARGVPCAYVPQGLDREVFAPGPRSPAERAPSVSLMTHRLDWKGLDDALAALAIVREQRPGLEVTLFGSEPIAGEGTFVASPTRPEVAALLGESAVHLVASWEEGFGLTGAEAIACGAALATTDTKGSRDYAIPGHTALVSAPRDPRALAHNVLALLEDAELRARLVSAGRRHLCTAMPQWPETARRMALALQCATAPPRL